MLVLLLLLLLWLVFPFFGNNFPLRSLGVTTAGENRPPIDRPQTNEFRTENIGEVKSSMNGFVLVEPEAIDFLLQFPFIVHG